MRPSYKIRLTEAEQVRDFVKLAGQCDFDIDIFHNRRIIDAKSILGVFSLDLSKVLTVRCSGQSEDFEKGIQKYRAA